MVVERYMIHGIRIQSAVPIAAQSDCASGSPDLVVTLTDKEGRPEVHGPPIAGGPDDYEVWRTPNGFWLRYAGIAEFEISRTAISVYAPPSTDLELLSLLLSGNALSLALVARGHFALHAGAIETRGRAIAVLGSSGMGKSTICGMLCAAGFRLVADDVLRVDSVGARAVCHLGSPELRLRESSGTIARLLPGWESRRSIDGRVVLRDKHSLPERIFPLDAIVVPELTTAGAPGVETARLLRAAAAIELIRHPRIFGWRDESVLEGMIRDLAELARTVPVYRLSFGRGRQFDNDFASELRKAVLSV